MLGGSGIGWPEMSAATASLDVETNVPVLVVQNPAVHCNPRALQIDDSRMQELLLGTLVPICRLSGFVVTRLTWVEVSPRMHISVPPEPLKPLGKQAAPPQLSEHPSAAHSLRTSFT